MKKKKDYVVYFKFKGKGGTEHRTCVQAINADFAKRNLIKEHNGNIVVKYVKWLKPIPNKIYIATLKNNPKNELVILASSLFEARIIVLEYKGIWDIKEVGVINKGVILEHIGR